MDNIYCVRRKTIRKVREKDGSTMLAYKLEHLCTDEEYSANMDELGSILDDWHESGVVPEYVYKDNGEIYTWNGNHMWNSVEPMPAFKVGRIKRELNIWWISKS